MKRPSRYAVLMGTAEIWARRSTCERAHVGCVVESRGRILVQGYNGAPAGMPHCNHTCDCNYLTNVKSFPLLAYHIQGCPAKEPCRVSVHAEANAVAYAARNGISLDGTRLFTTVAPCYVCSQLIINAGVISVVYRNNYRDMSGVELLEQAGIEVQWYGIDE